MKGSSGHISLLLACALSAVFGLSSLTAAAQNAFNATEYMHGVSDHNATALDLAALLGAEQRGYIDTTQSIAADEADSVEAAVPAAVLKLTGSATLNLEKELLSVERLQELTGQTIRFYLWIMGENIAAKDNLGACSPKVSIDIYDDYLNHVFTASSSFKTRGTFPWHCYYIDVTLPKVISISAKQSSGQTEILGDDEIFADINLGSLDTPIGTGIYLTLENLGGGTAWFRSLSYEVVTNEAAKRKAGWLDEQTGTMAPNPQYDELPMMMIFGISDSKPWNFLKGNNAFSSLLTIDGVRNYIRANGNDWLHLEKGIAMLPYLYVTGTTLKLADGFENNWLAAVKEEIERLQDPATGFWKANGTPNLMATAAIAAGCYVPNGFNRADRAVTATPWSALTPDAALPNAEAVINTLLACRVPGTDAWNQFCLQPANFGTLVRSTRTDLGTTIAAMRLLMAAAAALPPESPAAARAEQAIRDAYIFAMNNFLLKNQDGLWREDNFGEMPSPNGAFFLELFEVSRCLEQRINAELPKPVFTARVRSGSHEQVSVSWENPEAGLNSLRIYAVQEGTPVTAITEKNLIGVIEANAGVINRSDPYVAAKKAASAGRTKWGVTPALAGAVYLESKLAALPRRLTVGKPGSTGITVAAPTEIAAAVDDFGSSSPLQYFIAAADAYGAMTPFYTIEGELAAVEAPEAEENTDTYEEAAEELETAEPAAAEAEEDLSTEAEITE